MFCAGTYRKLLQHIAAPVLEEADISFNTVVNSITYKKNASEKVILGLQDGTEHEFDEVVVTTPLGWLQKNKHAFNPPLPAALTTAIDAISYGCLEKVSRPTYQRMEYSLTF